MSSKPALDLSLYLVTDSTPAILGERSIFTVVEEALRGGVTIVQYRDKTSDTGDLIRIGRGLHEITRKYRVPLIINDRVDVTLAVGAEGVHLGQDDMDIEDARQQLGSNAIIGASVSSTEEARKAIVDDRADYLGIGTVFATPTKEDTKSIIGTSGLQDILGGNYFDRQVPTVAIGGINASNVQRVLYQSSTVTKGLSGVAIVSAIMAAEDPFSAARQLLGLIQGPTPFYVRHRDFPAIEDVTALVNSVPSIVRRVGQQSPLSHNMTNLVVQNIAANVALCVGASPIMSNQGAEAADLAALKGGLVINMGTTTPEILSNHLIALQAYNKAGGPVVLDPVGAGATSIRRNAAKTLMKGGYFDLIKGNEGEIQTVLGQSRTHQHGVDSGPSSSSDLEKARVVKSLAAREHNVVLMTGATDYLSDGHRTYAIRNGHNLLGSITGSGCSLGTTLAAFLAVHKEDKLLAALAGILMFEIAAENAAGKDYVRGPGTFVPAFLDELYFIYRQTAIGRDDWCNKARVELVDV